MKRWLHQAFAILIAMLFTLSSASQAFAFTPEGKQCVTAPVQTIAVPLKDCCGKIVETKTRAVKPGDKEFKQCRCAEKNSSQFRTLSSERFSPILMWERLLSIELAMAAPEGTAITADEMASSHMIAPTPPPPLR